MSRQPIQPSAQPAPPPGALGRFNSSRILNPNSNSVESRQDTFIISQGGSSHPRTASTSAATSSQQQPQKPEVKSLFSFVPPKGDAQKLYKAKKDKEPYEDMASIFSILTATERLENMWARRGAIHQQDYEKQCDILIQQYNVLKGAIEHTVPSLERFIVDYDMKINFAANRLKAGVPQTASSAPGGKALGRVAMNCTSSFITILDCIESNLVEVGTLLPYLTTLTFNLDTMRKNAARNGQDANIDIREPYEWRERLNEMGAHESLTLEQAKQLKVDIDNAYQAFEHTLND